MLSTTAITENYTLLLSRELITLEDLLHLITDADTRQSIIMENYARAYIHHSCDTVDPAKKDIYMTYIQDILPLVQVHDNAMTTKILASPWIDQVPAEYGNLIKQMHIQQEIFRTENIALQTQDDHLATQYGEIVSTFGITYQEQSLTMQQGEKLLESYDRTERKDIYTLLTQTRLSASKKIDILLDEMITLRHQVALNAGFLDYPTYIFAAKGRFDYTQGDVFDYHHAVQKHITPLLMQLQRQRKKLLGVDTLSPRDMAVDCNGTTPLHPYTDIPDMLDKTESILTQIAPIFGKDFADMRSHDLLDLESRSGKRPGGYNYPLAVTRKPFIFMNATGSQSDVETLLHEAGHAMHSYQTASISHSGLRDSGSPSELCEVASMTMELLSMPYRDVYYKSPDDLRRARLQKISGELQTLCWVGCVDAFQYWLYTHIGHTHAERHDAWRDIYIRCMGTEIDWSQHEDYLAIMYQKQLHIFELPFYYIEYGIAGLAALRIWQASQQYYAGTIAKYISMLQLGYTKPLPECYAVAGITFGFADDVIGSLAVMIQNEIEKLTE